MNAIKKETSESRYDLEERTREFAKECRKFIKDIPNSISNWEDAKQLARSSGSVAANYIEANESLSKKDFFYRVKICRKEAKESILWLGLIDKEKKDELEIERERLIKEARELMNIFGAIVQKGQK